MNDLINAADRALCRRAAALSDEDLLAECAEEFFVASGPGGQHRNKTETGVRLRHLPTSVGVTATERRSQFENRLHALERLRARLAALGTEPKPRKKTRPSAASKRRRLDTKRKQSQKKQLRRGRED